MMVKVTVVVPTYNERDNLPVLVELLAALDVPDLHVLVVDDGSPDGTGRVADELTLDDGADVIVQMDADLSHPL